MRKTTPARIWQEGWFQTVKTVAGLWVTSMRNAFGKLEQAVNRSFEISLRTLFGRLRAAACGAGVFLLVPALMAQQLPPTPPNGRNARNAEQPAATATVEQEPEPEPSVPSTPQVSCLDGQLTIVAENSRLSDVLSEVRSCTGADLDLPASASRERVWVRLGPGPTRKVLATLLGSTELDFVIQASEDDPEEVRSVLLTVRTKPGSNTTGAGAAPTQNARRIPKANQPAQDLPAVENPAPVEPAATAEAAPSASPAASPSAGAPPTVPDSPSSTGTTASAITPNSNPSIPTASSTEQMIQKLQDMYEQRKQMQTVSKPPGTN
jgi:hypothetical protein